MKKAIKINIGGIIFHIDEDAYDKLKNYLALLEKHFGNNAEAKEIVGDIEARIAEIFKQKTPSENQAVTIADVDEVIKIMGSPEDFMDEANARDEKTTTTPPPPDKKIRRRFYRDIENSVLGGVCSGLAAYFSIDVVVLRIIFAIGLFLPVPVIITYLILWIAIPPARTAAQKLEMKGEDVNISTIGKRVREEYEMISRPGNRLRDFVSDFFEAIGKVLKVTFKVLGVIFGIILLIVGIALLIGLTSVFFYHPISFSSHSGIHTFDLHLFLNQFITPGTSLLIFILTIIIIALPVIGLLFLGIKLLFKYSIKNKWIVSTLMGLWIISFITLIGTILITARNFSQESSKLTTMQINIKSYKMLYISSNNLNTDDYKEFLDNYLISKDKTILGTPSLFIEKSYDNEAYLNINKSSRGKDDFDAVDNFKNIIYDPVQKDSLILFDPYFELKQGTKWRKQKMDITLRLPIGTKIYIDRSISSILIDAETNKDYWMSEMVGKVWIMTDRGLEEVKN